MKHSVVLVYCVELKKQVCPSANSKELPGSLPSVKGTFMVHPTV